ncbi:TetR/AcrR family transcriptional regulator [Chitinophaga horti]|uniref:TetR/AcrR family transcriptional regulator n=1 Tax=Chitinophaga horti TaxID=2920382 RepID=A0ABY6J7H9_9BACT|nr:TetR/AcrR family transcriptional regulator [Chitinophaga horti]UYQ94104.1 TetR/AcrR family transcriptional regulator [Chitinophaga horti]
MGISERKERERTEMRKRIVDAAVQTFKEEGYEKVSIRNIADKIEYSPATLYLYYKDKDELLLDAQRDAFDQLAAAFRSINFAPDPFARLTQIMESYMAFAKAEPELYDLMFIMKAPMNAVENPEGWDNGDDAFEMLKQCVDDCIAHDCIRFTDAVVGAISVWGFAHGLVSLDLKCRFKPTHLRTEMIKESMDAATAAYLAQIKK